MNLHAERYRRASSGRLQGPVFKQQVQQASYVDFGLEIQVFRLYSTSKPLVDGVPPHSKADEEALHFSRFDSILAEEVVNIISVEHLNSLLLCAGSLAPSKHNPRIG